MLNINIKKSEIDLIKPILRNDYIDKKVYFFDLIKTHNTTIEVEANNIAEAREKVKLNLE